MQEGLVITPTFTPEITVDDLDVAQFVYQLLENRRLREVLEAVTSRAVLILGRFGEQRRAALTALRKTLRDKEGLVPIGFDLPPAPSGEITEKVRQVAGVCRFVIADLADAADLPEVLAEAVCEPLEIPVQPIVPASQREYGMFEPLAQVHPRAP